MKNAIELFNWEGKETTRENPVIIPDKPDWINMKQAISVIVGSWEWKVLQHVGVGFVIPGKFEGKYVEVTGHGQPFTDDVDLERQYIYTALKRLPGDGVVPGPSFDELDLTVVADWRTRRDEARREQVAKAEARAEETSAQAALLGLPVLQGTPKQRAWAEDIRKEYFASTPADKVPARYKTVKTATWWIENRNKL